MSKKERTVEEISAELQKEFQKSNLLRFLSTIPMEVKKAWLAKLEKENSNGDSTEK